MENGVSLSIEFEHLLRRLFGTRYFGWAGWHSRTSWKKALVKIMNAIEKTAGLNVHSDSLHLEQLYKSIEVARAAAKTEDLCEPEYIGGLVEIIFLLLGRIPENRHKKVANKDAHFETNRYRSLHYSQNLSQKANLIKDYGPPAGDRKECNRVSERYWRALRTKDGAKTFVDWYKKEYPDRYAELF